MFKNFLLVLIRVGVLLLGYLNADRLFPQIHLDNMLNLAGVALGFVLIDMVFRPIFKLFLFPVQLLTLGFGAHILYGMLLLGLIVGVGLYVDVFHLGSIDHMSMAQTVQAILAIWIFTWTLLIVTRIEFKKNKD